VDHSLDQGTLPDADHGESRLSPPPTATAHDDGTSPTALPCPTAGNASRSTGQSARTVWVWTICGCLLLAVGLVFGQTVRHEFIPHDDNSFVYENPHATTGLTLPGLWWALTDGTFGEWTPLSSLSHMLDCQLYGVNPAGHHLTNVLLHAASSVLLFLALLRMTRELWPTAWVAAVFAIHPLHVESVAWVAERRDVLSGLFFMLTLGAYALYAERPSLARYLAVAGCLALGLMSKPIIVTTPFVLLLLDYWPLGRFRPATDVRPQAGSSWWFDRWPIGWRLLAEKVPLLALSATSCAITLSTHASIGHNPADRLPLATRLANAVVSYAAYLGQSLFPIRLAHLYPHLGNRLPMAWAVEALVLLVAITAACAYCWRSRPYLLVGWLWFLGMLVPVIGLVVAVLESRADRYTYLSQIGLSIAVAWSGWSIYRSRQARRPMLWRRWTLAIVSGGAVLVLATLAWRQASYWRNSETLWTQTLASTGQNFFASYSLGYTYASQGKNEEAIPHLRDALASPSITRFLTADCHDFLAAILAKQGQTDEALAQLEQAIRVFPESATFHSRLAVELKRQGKFDRAIDEWRQVVRLNPNSPQPRVGLANTMLANGETARAIHECREVLKDEPDTIEAIFVLATALAAEGKAEEAIPALQRALQIDPQSAPVHFRLGLALNDQGDSKQALVHLNEAVRLKPDDVPALWQTAWILATNPDASIRNGAEGVELATRAIRLSGGREPRAFDALAAALAESKNFSAAVEVAEQASAAALVRGDSKLIESLAERARLYRQSLPYRQAGSAGSGNPAPAE
jgi:tetratricopeptide (TPR) repeat protein